MPNPDTYPLLVIKGNVFRFEVEVLSDQTGKPFPDWEQHTGKMQARWEIQDDDPFVECVVDDDSMVLQANGVSALVIPSAVTDAINIGENVESKIGVWSWEIYPYGVAADAWTLMGGPIEVKLDVTR